VEAPAPAPGPKRARAASKQQAPRDLSREALALAAADIDNIDSFAQALAPQPAAAAVGSAATGEAGVMAALLGHLRSINDRLDQQAAQSVVVPAVPAALTTTTAMSCQEVVTPLPGGRQDSGSTV
jgi:hypothetical protein